MYNSMEWRMAHAFFLAFVFRGRNESCITVGENEGSIENWIWGRKGKLFGRFLLPLLFVSAMAIGREDFYEPAYGMAGHLDRLREHTCERIWFEWIDGWTIVDSNGWYYWHGRYSASCIWSKSPWVWSWAGSLESWLQITWLLSLILLSWLRLNLGFTCKDINRFMWIFSVICISVLPMMRTKQSTISRYIWEFQLQFVRYWSWD